MTRPRIFYATAASAALMIVGGFGPWATVLGFLTVSGTRGDGWFIIIGGAIAGGLLARELASHSTQRWLMVVSAIVGAICLAITGADLADINNVGDAGALGHIVDPAWGLIVALLGSAGLLVCSILTVRQRPYATGLADG